MNANRSRKVLLVGWDAADWKVIHPLIDAGKLPTVRRLIERGVMGKLATLHPVLSPMLWTSIATGKRPSKHGIHGFTEPASDGSGIQPVTNLSRKTKAIWNILSQNGLSNNIVAWWPSHPAEPIRGAMVSNRFQRAVGPPESPWPVSPGAVHPPALTETLAALRLNPNELLAEHILPFVPLANEIDQQADRRLATCGKILAECTTVNAVATWLMAHRPADFTAVYFDAIDHFCHGFMRYHPPRQPHISDSDFELYRHVVEAGYRYHDMMLNTLIELSGPESTVILMSDHGFHSDHLRPQRLPAEPAGPAFEHRDFGVFVMAGPGIRQDALLHGVGLLDIAPTLLSLFGLPVGVDMDGRVMGEAFTDPPVSESIPSWDDVPGNAGLHAADMRLDPVESSAALEQLVALGYIEPPPANRQAAIDQTVRELRYNLARSLMDDGQHGAAAEIFDELYRRWPNEHRFGVQLAYCFLALERIADLRLVIEDLGTRRKADAEAARCELREVLRRLRAERDASNNNVAISADQKREVLDLRRRSAYDPRAIEYLWGSVALAEGEYEKAIGHLQRSETPGVDRPALCLQIGEAYLRLRQPDQAERSFARVAGIDPDNPHAHLGMARVHLLRRDNQAAAQSALQAIGLRYQLPLAHFVLGRALIRLDRTLPAAEALQAALAINPHFPEAHRLLAIIYRRLLGDFEQAGKHRRLAREMRAARRAARSAKQQFVPANNEWQAASDRESSVVHDAKCVADPRKPSAATSDAVADTWVTVISGLPRSGTSLVMQMLAAGGMPILTDGRREKDESNPRGYFEYEPVKNLRNDNKWLAVSQGQAVKIITQLLPYLALGLQYRIVYVERDLDEVLLSQRRMLERSGQVGFKISDDQLRRTYAAQVSNIRRWLTLQANVKLQTISFRQILDDPSESAIAIAEFLGGTLNVDAMAATVDPSLYRSRA